MHSDAKRRIFRFEEKPKDPKLLDELRIPPDLLNGLGRPADAELYQGSMGIYVFNRQILIDALDNSYDDFGKHIIPASLQEVQSLCLYLPGILGGHWNGSGLFRSEPGPDAIRFRPTTFLTTSIRSTRSPRFLPASKINGTQVQQGDHRRRLHYYRREYRPGGHRYSERDRNWHLRSAIRS